MNKLDEEFMEVFGLKKEGIVYFVESRESGLWLDQYILLEEEKEDHFWENNLTDDPIEAFSFTSKEWAKNYISIYKMNHLFKVTEHEFI